MPGESEAPAQATVAQRWLARLSLAAVAAAVLVLLVVAGARSLLLVALGLSALAVTAAGVWWTNLSVTPPVSPIQVEAQIQDAFQRKAGVDARQVRVEVTDRTARLYGHVHSLQKANAAQGRRGGRTWGSSSGEPPDRAPLRAEPPRIHARPSTRPRAPCCGMPPGGQFPADVPKQEDARS